MTKTTDFLDAENEKLRASIIDLTLTRGEDEKRIATLEAENARLTAAHAMQDESLVVLPRHMVNSIEEKMKEQAAEIARLTEKVRYAYVQIEALEAK